MDDNRDESIKPMEAPAENKEQAENPGDNAAAAVPKEEPPAPDTAKGPAPSAAAGTLPDKAGGTEGDQPAVLRMGEHHDGVIPPFGIRPKGQPHTPAAPKAEQGKSPKKKKSITKGASGWLHKLKRKWKKRKQAKLREKQAELEELEEELPISERLKPEGQRPRKPKPKPEDELEADAETDGAPGPEEQPAGPAEQPEPARAAEQTEPAETAEQAEPQDDAAPEDSEAASPEATETAETPEAPEDIELLEAEDEEAENRRNQKKKRKRLLAILIIILLLLVLVMGVSLFMLLRVVDFKEIWPNSGNSVTVDKDQGGENSGDSDNDGGSAADGTDNAPDGSPEGDPDGASSGKPEGDPDGDAGPNGASPSGTDSGSLPPSDTSTGTPVSQETLAARESVEYIKSFSPADLGLDGESMDEYQIYPAEGNVRVDDMLCAKVTVYSTDNAAGTNFLEGTFLIGGGVQRRIFRLDQVTGEVTEVQLPVYSVPPAAPSEDGGTASNGGDLEPDGSEPDSGNAD